MKRAILFLITTTILVLCTMAKPPKTDYFPFKKGDKWGVFDNTGRIILQPTFDTIAEFRDGIAYFYQNGKCGYIGTNGNKIIPNIYTWCNCFSEGVARVTDSTSIELIIDTIGHVLFASRLDTIDYESTYGLFVTCSDTSEDISWNCKSCYIDKYGKTKIVTGRFHGSSFYEGLARLGNDHESVYIDTLGNIVLRLPIFWGDCADPSDGLIRIRADSSIYYLRTTMPDIEKPYLVKKADISLYYRSFVNGYAVVYNRHVQKHSFMDKKGRMIIEPSFDLMEDFGEGLAAVKNFDGKYGFIDTLGNLVLPMQYDNVLLPFKKGLAMVVYNGQIIWIDKKGRVWPE